MMPEESWQPSNKEFRPIQQAMQMFAMMQGLQQQRRAMELQQQAAARAAQLQESQLQSQALQRNLALEQQQLARDKLALEHEKLAVERERYTALSLEKEQHEATKAAEKEEKQQFAQIAHEIPELIKRLGVARQGLQQIDPEGEEPALKGLRNLLDAAYENLDRVSRTAAKPEELKGNVMSLARAADQLKVASQGLESGGWGLEAVKQSYPSKIELRYRELFPNISFVQDRLAGLIGMPQATGKGVGYYGEWGEKKRVPIAQRLADFIESQTAFEKPEVVR